MEALRKRRETKAAIAYMTKGRIIGWGEWSRIKLEPAHILVPSFRSKQAKTVPPTIPTLCVE